MTTQTAILNLTMHPSSPEQKEAGVFEPADKEKVKGLLNFGDLPSRQEILDRALKLAEYAHAKEGAEAVMIGGAPFFMAPLENALYLYDIKVYYAFSARESTEYVNEEGETVKTSKFVHKGFVPAHTQPPEKATFKYELFERDEEG